jgi:hypothetical protein
MEARLLEMGLMATGAQPERLCRGYRGVLDRETPPRPEERSVRVRHLDGGMVRLDPVLEPDEADMILRAVERAREVKAEQAGALKAAEKKRAFDAAGVSAETLRRVACDCGLVAARRDGEALNIGRRARSIPGGWAVTAAADGVFVFRSPTGKSLWPEPPRYAAVGWLLEAG